MTEHDTRVLHDNVAACRCGWRLACIDAITAARECWAHIKAHARRLDVEETG